MKKTDQTKHLYFPTISIKGSYVHTNVPHNVSWVLYLEFMNTAKVIAVSYVHFIVDPLHFCPETESKTNYKCNYNWLQFLSELQWLQ